MKLFYGYYFLCFHVYALSQNTYQTNLSRIISLSDASPISYKISINTEIGIVNGFSTLIWGDKMKLNIL